MSNRLVARGIIEGSKRPFFPTSLTPRNKSIAEKIVYPVYLSAIKVQTDMLRTLARLLSYLFHPLFVLTYLLVLLLCLNPYLFGANSIDSPIGKELVLRIFLSSAFIPGAAVLMLRFTGLLKSLDMPDKQDRTGPLIITGMFYIWLFRNFLDNTQVPALLSSFTLGASLGLFLAFFINIFSKISLHAVGMGGLIGAVALLWGICPEYLLRAGHPLLQAGFLFPVLFVLAGGVGSARMYLGAHRPADLWGGYLVGFAAQLVAARFIL